MSKVTLKVEVDESMYKRLTSKEKYVAVNDCQVYQEWGEFCRAIKHGIPIAESEDCVSRSAVLDVLLNGNNNFRRAEDIINELPSVIPKREQGEWIFEEVGVRTQVLKCSKCGTIIQRGENFTQEEFRKYINDILREKCITLNNFCHNCGVEMR